VQTFQTKPTDAELAGLLDPERRSIQLRVEDTPERLIVHPRGYPMWIVVASLSLPVGAIATWLVHDLVRDIKDSIALAVLPLSVIVAALFSGFIWLINCGVIRHGSFFILDKNQRTLTLPRLGVSLPGDQLEQFVEVHIWDSQEKGWGSEREWLRELSVIVRTDGGGYIRYPVITSSGGDVSRWAKHLAEFFGVDRRLLKSNWWERGRLNEMREAD